MTQGLRFPLARCELAICDLARLASGIYYTIIIINNTNLVHFYSFHFSFNTLEIRCLHFQCAIKRSFLEIMCLCTRYMKQCFHTRAPIQITHIRPTRNFMPRSFPSQPAKFALIFAIKCLQCRDTKMSKSAKVLNQSHY